MYIYNQYSFVPLEELLSSDGIGYPKLNFRVHTHALHRYAKNIGSFAVLIPLVWLYTFWKTIKYDNILPKNQKEYRLIFFMILLPKKTRVCGTRELSPYRAFNWKSTSTLSWEQAQKGPSTYLRYKFWHVSIFLEDSMDVFFLWHKRV